MEDFGSLKKRSRGLNGETGLASPLHCNSKQLIQIKQKKAEVEVTLNAMKYTENGIERKEYRGRGLGQGTRGRRGLVGVGVRRRGLDMAGD